MRTSFITVAKRGKMVLSSLAIVSGLLSPSFSSIALGDTATTVIPVSATITGFNTLDVTILNSRDDQATNKVVFLTPSGVIKADQYLRIGFDSNVLGAKIIIRTDNRNSAIPYTGAGEGAGLVGNTDSSRSVPLLWAIFPDLASAKAFQFTGDTDPTLGGVGPLPGANPRVAGEAEGLVVDKANPNFEAQSVLDYATAVVPQGTNGLLGNFPVDVDGAGPSTGSRTAVSPVYLVLGADFFTASAQTYSTSTLALDLIEQ